MKERKKKNKEVWIEQTTGYRPNDMRKKWMKDEWKMIGWKDCEMLPD